MAQSEAYCNRDHEIIVVKIENADYQHSYFSHNVVYNENKFWNYSLISLLFCKCFEVEPVLDSVESRQLDKLNL